MVLTISMLANPTRTRFFTYNGISQMSYSHTREIRAVVPVSLAYSLGIERQLVHDHTQLTQLTPDPTCPDDQYLGFPNLSKDLWPKESFGVR
jgi:hypothetical protein